MAAADAVRARRRAMTATITAPVSVSMAAVAEMAAQTVKGPEPAASTAR